MTQHLEEFEPDPQTHYNILREARLSEATDSSAKEGFWERLAVSSLLLLLQYWQSR